MLMPYQALCASAGQNCVRAYQGSTLYIFIITRPPRLNWFERAYCSDLYMITKTNRSEMVTSRYSMVVWPFRFIRISLELHPHRQLARLAQGAVGRQGIVEAHAVAKRLRAVQPDAEGEAGGLVHPQAVHGLVGHVLAEIVGRRIPGAQRHAAHLQELLREAQLQAAAQPALAVGIGFLLQQQGHEGVESEGPAQAGHLHHLFFLAGHIMPGPAERKFAAQPEDGAEIEDQVLVFL